MRSIRLPIAALLLLMLLSIFKNPTPSALAQGGGTPTPEPFDTCGRTIANVVRLLIRDYEFKPVAAPSNSNYCTALETEVNVFMEQAILEPSLDEGVAGESRDAFAFVDYAAQQFVGVMPSGTKFTAVARNGLPGSQMMLVQGEGFSVFVDYTFTTLKEFDFGSLPDYRDYDGSLETFCRAQWCRNAGPPPRRP
ncbi:MAG: hypothetical protein OHK0023_18720 [Anaerolineae bacterium]